MTNFRALERLSRLHTVGRRAATTRCIATSASGGTTRPLVEGCFGHRPHDLDALRRASQRLQATGLGYAVEADRRRYPRCSMVLPWQLNESYPNAWCTSSVDHRGDPKPAYSAVRRAFEPSRVTIRVPTTVWSGEPELRAEAWLWSEPELSGGTSLLARLRDAHGVVLAEARWPVAEPVSVPRAVGALTVPAVDLPAVVVWDFAWQDADGADIDREVVIAATGADLAPLLDVQAADVTVTAIESDEATAVHVAHRGGPMVVGLEVRDNRPYDAPGWVVPSGDPRPLLPGEQRSFPIRGTGADAPWPVVVDGWNLAPVHVVLKEA